MIDRLEDVRTAPVGSEWRVLCACVIGVGRKRRYMAEDRGRWGGGDLVGT